MRELQGWQHKVVGWWLVLISVFQLYTATVGIFQPRIQRGLHLLFLLPAAFLLLFRRAKSPLKPKIGIADFCLALFSLFSAIIHYSSR